MTGRQAAIALLGMLCWLPLASAQGFVRISNRLTPDQFLNIERGPIQSSRVEPQWWSAEWRVEAVPGTHYVRLRNRWKSGEFLRVRPGELDWMMLAVSDGYVRLQSRARESEYLHLERGVLQTGAVPRDAPSSHWMVLTTVKPPAMTPRSAAYQLVNRAVPHHVLPLLPVADLPYVRVSSRGTQFVHIEHGRLEIGDIDQGWWSAQWRVEPVPGTPHSRIRNRWRSDQLLYVENNQLKSGPVSPDLPGAQWSPPPAPAPVSDRWHGPN